MEEFLSYVMSYIEWKYKVSITWAGCELTMDSLDYMKEQREQEMIMVNI